MRQCAINARNFCIDDAVPLPPKKGRRPRSEWRQWPFAIMELGNSFFAAAMLEAISAQAAAREYEREHPDVKFATRATDCDEITKLPGVRLWRIR
ncbi:MAG TPA: hypothetical protein VFS52_20760 [Steroidobacteraceae bacterium]|nr:hypothetical protein [Steroidobacteraceae bacterium]